LNREGEVMKKIRDFLNEDNKKLNKKDFIILGIIVLIYTIISFYRLGDTISPNTFYLANIDDELVIELNNPDDIIRMKIYNGYCNAFYSVYTSNDNINYDYVMDIEGSGAFSWDSNKILKKAKYLKLTFTSSSSLGEIALYNNSKEKISIKEITSNSNEIVTTLTDEEETIPTTLSHMNSSIFDEVYFARTAYEYVNNITIYEWTHPPLGKLIQAIPYYLTKHFSPFIYRLMGNISGILMLIVMYLFGKMLFKKRKYACFSSLLMALDTFHFTQTRMGTVDSHLVLFIMLSVLFMFNYFTSKKNYHLFLSGLFFSLSICVKWTGFYAGLALAIIYFVYMFKNKDFNLESIVKGIVFFVFVPVFLYVSIYLLFPNNNLHYTNTIDNVIAQQKEMYKYHSTLTSTHTFSSKWYTWPISYRPIWYYTTDLDNNYRETIALIGNIVIWWVGIISTLYLLLKIFIKKDKKSFYLLIVILSLWLPYLFIGRVMFLYHYFPVLPFLMLSIVNMFRDIEEKFKKNFIISIYLLLALSFFIIYYPVTSGYPVSNTYIEKLRLFDSWYF
jgi:dolichyl-phosphate-mannose--protein O-mannosyl transferase